jgi:hypothetical protein
MPATKLSMPSSLPPLSSSFFCIIRACSDITADQITFNQVSQHIVFPDACTVLFSGSLLSSVLSIIFCISQNLHSMVRWSLIASLHTRSLTVCNWPEES